MTRREILDVVIRQALAKGFDFPRWFSGKIDPSWTTHEAAVDLLSRGRRYYALLFSHEFARCFWKQGTKINFLVPSASYIRKDKDGRIVTITRKAFTRRTLKSDAWKYHLQQMSAQEEPLRYLQRFLITEEHARQSPKSSS